METNTITVNGTTTNLSKAQLQSLTSRITKAKANAAALAAIKVTPRGKATMGDALQEAGDRAADLKARAISVAEDFLSLGKEIVIMRSAYPSDKLWGAFIKGSTFERELSPSDRSDLMYLGRNYPVAYKALAKAKEDGITQVGISALRKRTKAMADSEGVQTTVRDTSAKKPKASVASIKSEKAIQATPSKDNGAAKVAKKAKPSLDDIASDALEQAVTHGYEPQDLLAALTKAIMQSALESA